MVKQTQYMEEAGASSIIRRIDSSLMKIYRILPFTYICMIRRAFGKCLKTKKRVTMLDLGCGDGTMTGNLKLPLKFEITGVDLFVPYIELARKKKIYKYLIKANIKKLKFAQKFDIIFASHVLKHLEKKDGKYLVEKLERTARDKIIFIVPVGHLHQDTYDGNIYQKHKSEWYPKDFIDKGYSVVGSGLKIIYKEENIIKKYGLFAYFFFAVSFLFQPLLLLKPEWATYMVCKKGIKD